jgi:ATP phosphoribosyltransferase
VVDVESVLLSVEERDKWRHRMETLLSSLKDTQEKRRRLEVRLRRIKSELARLHEIGPGLFDPARSHRAQVTSAAHTVPFVGR